MKANDWQASLGFIEGIVDDLDNDPAFAAAVEDAANRSDLIAALTECRSMLGLTQSVIAERMGTTQSAVSDLENRRTDPHLSTLQRYARAVNRVVEVQVASPHRLIRGGWTAPEGVKLNSQSGGRRATTVRGRWTPQQPAPGKVVA